MDAEDAAAAADDDDDDNDDDFGEEVAATMDWGVEGKRMMYEFLYFCFLILFI